jgi:hypothetical protein
MLLSTMPENSFEKVFPVAGFPFVTIQTYTIAIR